MNGLVLEKTVVCLSILIDARGLVSYEAAAPEIISQTVDVINCLWFVSRVILLLFPVDRDTCKFFGRLRSNDCHAASLFKMNHVAHLNVPCEGLFHIVASHFCAVGFVKRRRVYM